MATYAQLRYCPKCKKTVTASKDEKCKKCGSKVSRGKWFVMFYIDDFYGKKQKRLSGFETKREAQSAYVDFMSTYVPIQREPKKTYIFEEILKEYLNFCKTDNANSTLYEKERIFDLYILPVFKGCDMQKITKAQYVNWQTSLWNLESDKTNKKFSHEYLSKIRGFLYSFLAYVENIYDIPNHLRTIKIPKNTDKKKKIEFWELSTFETFINQVDDPLWQTVWSVFFFTGARFNEIRALSDDDIGADRIVINKALEGKKAKSRDSLTKSTKNYKVVDKKIPEPLSKQILKYKEWKKENNIPSKFLFGGDKPLSENMIRRRLRDDVNNANVKYISPHGFRHSYVSLLIEMGISSKIIAELIGDREEQVIKTYGHLYANAKEKAIDMLNEHLSEHFKTR